ncbi:MAG: tRNA (adenosine(37)-N6)-threonylcarbamoyltransferase complex dimerization subunit type 1 TsaB [Treponema sp.]|nr:tRNA (adenosine(37)-N6)-threonylcarbamoyltransferase complex dimerization subunit type 1 TsaB [Treponema sp.]
MNLLAIDTFCSILSIAVVKGEDNYYIETEAGTRHSELVMDIIDEQMKKAGLEPKDLNVVLCMEGPGSFTGLRIGYSIAKGLALSLFIPIIPVSTLDCIALNTDTLVIKDTLCENDYNKLILSVIESRKNSYYYAFYSNGQRITDEKDAEVSLIQEEIKCYNKMITIKGPGSVNLYESIPLELRRDLNLNYFKKGYANEIIAIAKQRKMLDNDNSVFLSSGPKYIRKTDAEIGKLNGLHN